MLVTLMATTVCHVCRRRVLEKDWFDGDGVNVSKFVRACARELTSY
jgi:hypothetical protein